MTCSSQAWPDARTLSLGGYSAGALDWEDPGVASGLSVAVLFSPVKQGQRACLVGLPLPACWALVCINGCGSSLGRRECRGGG